MIAELSIPLVDSANPTHDPFETIAIWVNPKSAELEINDHNHADSLKLAIDWKQSGTDPRHISSAMVRFYLANADDYNLWDTNDASLRFCGRVASAKLQANGDSPIMLELECRDFTSLFLCATKFATEGIPKYSETLDKAWQRICKHTPGAEQLGPSIEFFGLDKPPSLDKAVSDRLRESNFHPKADADAWSIWQQCVGACGLISFFYLDRCIVTTATDYYTAGNPPLLIRGVNVLDLSLERNNEFTLRGVGIQSFDPLSGRVIEGLWPPVGDARVKHKKIGAAKKHDKASLFSKEERDFFQFGSITHEAQAIELAKRVYEERSRQQMRGTVTTAEMSVATTSDDDFNLLDLSSGDVIHIEFDRKIYDALAEIDSESDRVAYLTQKANMREELALVLARNMSALAAQETSFYVQTVKTTLEATATGGSFRIEVQFCNRILPSGSASEQDAPGTYDASQSPEAEAERDKQKKAEQKAFSHGNPSATTGGPFPKPS